jgi:hypothetical protein
MNISQYNQALLVKLYSAADSILELAPWKFMEEWQVFCVEEPFHKTTCFVSVLGSLGEHYAISVYPGIKEYMKLLDFYDLEDAMDPEELFSINQWQLSFEDRSHLEKEDLQFIKDSGMTFRGKNGWPMFRSFRDGYFPWLLEPEEMEMMTVILEQSEVMFRRIQKDPGIHPQDDFHFLVRYAEKQGGRTTWKEMRASFILPESEALNWGFDRMHLTKLRKLPASANVYEFDFFQLPSPIQQSRSERPYMAAMAILVEKRSGMVLGFEMFGEKADRHRRMELAPDVFMKLLAKQKARPREIAVRQPLFFDLMFSILDDAGVTLRLEPRLFALEEARQAVLQFMSEGMA